MKIIERIRIQSKPEQIFSFLMNLDNRKSYIPALEKVIMLTPLPIQVGSRYIEIANIGGRRLKTTYEVTSYKLNQEVVAKTIESVFPIQAKLSLKPSNETTILSIELELKLKGVFRMASGIVSGIVSQQAKGILKKIKSNTENRS